MFSLIGLLSLPTQFLSLKDVLSGSWQLPCRLIHKIKSSALSVKRCVSQTFNGRSSFISLSLIQPQIRFKNHGRLRNDQGIGALMEQMHQMLCWKKRQMLKCIMILKRFLYKHVICLIAELASDVGYQLVSKVKHDGCQILAIDESIEITDVAQLNIFI